MIGTRSSAELPRLAIVVAWAKAVGLLRVVHGRLVPMKKNQRLLDRPVDLWTAMFAAFDHLGPALCPPGWFAPLLGEDFSDGIAVLFATIAGGGGGTARIVDAQERVWSALSNRYYLDEATTEQLGHIRAATDRPRDDTARNSCEPHHHRPRQAIAGTFGQFKGCSATR